MTVSPGRRLIAWYLSVQSLLGGVWWLVLWLHTPSRGPFVPSGIDERFLVALALPDVLLFVLASALGALFARLDHRAMRAVLMLCAGAVTYATLLCLGFHLAFGGYGAPSVMMAAAMVCTLALVGTARSEEPEHARLPMGTARADASVPAWLRTLLQVVIFWGLFLLVLPLVIAWCEGAVGFPSMGRSWWIGGVLFALGGLLGVWSATVMVRRGKGTPLPTDAAPRLVVTGPYRFVRNPMALGGIAQGIGVSVMLGSWWTLAYALLGGLLWDRCIRPIEEHDLRTRFGEPFEMYAKSVRCWIPGKGTGDAASQSG